MERLHEAGSAFTATCKFANKHIKWSRICNAHSCILHDILRCTMNNVIKMLLQWMYKRKALYLATLSWRCKVFFRLPTLIFQNHASCCERHGCCFSHTLNLRHKFLLLFDSKKYRLFYLLRMLQLFYCFFLIAVAFITYALYWLTVFTTNVIFLFAMNCLISFRYKRKTFLSSRSNLHFAGHSR